MFQKYSMVLVAALIFMSGCAFMEQKVEFAPQVDVQESKIGAGKKVALEISDERDGQVLGRRGTAYGMAAKIKTTQDIKELFATEITKGLEKKGFVPVADSDKAARKLKIEIRLLQYEASTGFWTLGSEAKTTLKAVAQNDGKIYEQLYRIGSGEKRTVFVPTANSNSQLLNESVSNAISEVFRDNKLISFLADGQQIDTVTMTASATEAPAAASTVTAQTQSVKA